MRLCLWGLWGLYMFITCITTKNIYLTYHLTMTRDVPMCVVFLADKLEVAIHLLVLHPGKEVLHLGYIGEIAPACACFRKSICVGVTERMCVYLHTYTQVSVRKGTWV